MAIETPCQTPGTTFHTAIDRRGSWTAVELPFDLNLSEDDAKVLEANIHNALELVFAPFFKK